MVTSAVSSATSSSAATKATGTAQLDRNAFLKLLIAQLQNQDPMKPMEDKEFISQLAQFSSLEQMQSLSQDFSNFSSGFGDFSAGFLAFSRNQVASQAFGMIGHKVQYLDAKTGEKVEGIVSSVGFAAGGTKLNIGDTQVDLGNVVTVY